MSPRTGIYYGWYVAASAVVIFFFTNGLAVFVPQSLAPRLLESFQANPGQLGLATTITFVTTACLAPFAGALVDRLGAVRVMRAGLLLIGLSFAGYPFARSLGELYALHLGFGVGLVLCGLLVSVVLLSRWFVTRRGLVVGALVAGSSLAGAALPQAISPWVTDPAFGWRWGYGGLAAAFLVLGVLPGFLLLRESPATLGLHPDGAAVAPAAGTGEKSGATLATALRSRTLWCLALGSACLWFCNQAILSQLTIFLEREAHLPPRAATDLFSLVFAVSFGGKFLYGAASDWFPKRQVMLAAALTLLAGCLLLFEMSPAGPRLVTDATRLTAFAAVFGLGFGGGFTMIQLTTVESFGQRELGRILGVVIFVDAIGGGLAPFVAGRLATVTGGYLVPFALVTAVAVVAVINVLFIRPLRRS